MQPVVTVGLDGSAESPAAARRAVAQAAILHGRCPVAVVPHV
ncbi:hypothetical protein ACIHCM_14785 [Streptomyces sp. NPDC052023]